MRRDELIEKARRPTDLPVLLSFTPLRQLHGSDWGSLGGGGGACNIIPNGRVGRGGIARYYMILRRCAISSAHKLEVDYHDLLMVMLYIALYIVMRLTM